MTPYDQVLGDGGKEEFPLIGKYLWQNQDQWGSALSVIGWRGEGKKENKIETTLSLCSMLAILTAACWSKQLNK